MSERPLMIVDGNVDQAPPHRLVRLARSLPLARAVVDSQPVSHAAATRKFAKVVRESARFAAAEMIGLPGVRRYHLRMSGRPVLLRHATTDIWTLNEIFRLRLYEPPPAVAGSLERVEAPLVVDLGANIGMFGVDALSRYPRARVVAYEPEPESAAIHRRLVEISRLGASWRLVEACAGTREGTVSFSTGLATRSHIAAGSGPGIIEARVVDVMPQLTRADLVKIDIEGAEWDLLADPRFGEVRNAVIEYHPRGCPSGDPQGTADELLRARGFELSSIFHNPDTNEGMLWATR